MTQAITLEALGLDTEKLTALVVAEAVEQLLNAKDPGPKGDGLLAEGHLYPYEDFATRIIELAKQRADERVDELGATHIVPRVDEFIATLVLAQTNKWGEKQGKPMTIVEFLVARCDAYMREDVDSDGNSEADCRRTGRSWGHANYRQPRMTQMIDKYMKTHMQEAVRQILDSGGAHLKENIEKTFKSALASVVQDFQVTIKAKTP